MTRLIDADILLKELEAQAESLVKDAKATTDSLPHLKMALGFTAAGIWKAIQVIRETLEKPDDSLSGR